jgi:hypothetical protein
MRQPPTNSGRPASIPTPGIGEALMAEYYTMRRGGHAALWSRPDEPEVVSVDTDAGLFRLDMFLGRDDG